MVMEAGVSYFAISVPFLLSWSAFLHSALEKTQYHVSYLTGLYFTVSFVCFLGSISNIGGFLGPGCAPFYLVYLYKLFRWDLLVLGLERILIYFQHQFGILIGMTLRLQKPKQNFSSLLYLPIWVNGPYLHGDHQKSWNYSFY